MGCKCTEVTKDVTTIIQQGAKGDTGPKGDDGPVGDTGPAGTAPGESFEAVISGDYVVTGSWANIPGLSIDISDDTVGYLLFFTLTGKITDPAAYIQVRAAIDGNAIPNSTRVFGDSKAAAVNAMELPIVGQCKIGEPLDVGTVTVQVIGNSSPPGVTITEGIMHLLEIKRS